MSNQWFRIEPGRSFRIKRLRKTLPKVLNKFCTLSLALLEDRSVPSITGTWLNWPLLKASMMDWGRTRPSRFGPITPSVVGFSGM